MGNALKTVHRVHTSLEEKVVRHIIGDGFGLYESYANDIPISIKQKCDFELKTQGAVRVAYDKKYIGEEQEIGQDIARSIGGVLHYHESSFGGVSHWTPNIYARADHHSYISTNNLRRVQTICFDIDQKMSVQQILFAFEYMGFDFLPFLILSTPKGVQFFVRFEEAWYGEKGINYAKDIANRLKKEMNVLPIDTGKEVFGWARFPREETIMYFEPSNVWNCEEAKEWHSEFRVDRFRTGKSMYTKQAWYNELKKYGEVGNRNSIILQLASANCKDEIPFEDALEEILAWNNALSVSQKPSEVIRTVRSSYDVGGYWFDTDMIEDFTGFSVVTKGWYKHKKTREQRKYDHKHELVDDLTSSFKSHFEKVSPEGEGEVMPLEVTSRQLAQNLFGEVKKHKSITRALEAIHNAPSGFVVRKKKDANGNALKGRGAGYLVYRTQDLINTIRRAKQVKTMLLTSLVYRAATFAEKHQEQYVSKSKYTPELMCQLPIKVSTRTLTVYEQYLEILSTFIE